MGAIRSSHLEVLAYSNDVAEQARQAVIVSFITQNFLSEDGIMEWLISERKALLEQQNTEAEAEGSPYMEPDSGTNVAD